MTGIQVLGYGGGRQTVAMCLLVVRDILPRPDYIVMADTGREASSTFHYLETYVQPLLGQHGMGVEIASHDLATVDLYARNGDLLMPVYTSTGKLRTFCSDKWKKGVSERYLRSIGVTSATTWIGFTADEAHRVKGYGESPWYRRYPLIELMLSRTDCERIITEYGWPLPEKSACWMCPHRSNVEWRAIRDGAPDEWRQAVAMDVQIREDDDRHGVYLHHSRVPLGEADIDREDRREPDRHCALGTCWV